MIREHVPDGLERHARIFDCFLPRALVNPSVEIGTQFLNALRQRFRRRLFQFVEQC
jgi:hypothetical protein